MWQRDRWGSGDVEHEMELSTSQRNIEKDATGC